MIMHFYTTNISFNNISVIFLVHAEISGPRILYQYDIFTVLLYFLCYSIIHLYIHCSVPEVSNQYNVLLIDIHTKYRNKTAIIQGVPGGMCNTSGECSLC